MISSSSSDDNDGRSSAFEDKVFSKDSNRDDNFSEDSGFVTASLEPQLCVCVCVFENRKKGVEIRSQRESGNERGFTQKLIHRVILKLFIDLYMNLNSE